MERSRFPVTKAMLPDNKAGSRRGGSARRSSSFVHIGKCIEIVHQHRKWEFRRPSAARSGCWPEFRNPHTYFEKIRLDTHQRRRARAVGYSEV